MSNFFHFPEFQIEIFYFFTHKKGSLIVNNQIMEFELPMSIQQCYESFFANSTLLLDEYKIFNSLVNFGFIVRESSNAPETKPVTACRSLKQQSNSDECESVIKKSDHGQLSKQQILSKLNDIVPSVQLGDIKNRLIASKSKSNKYRPTFDVFLPNKNFKKSQPGEPFVKVCAKFRHTKENIYLPKLIDLIECNDTSDKSSRSKILFGFSNESDPIYYSFDCSFKLPDV